MSTMESVNRDEATRWIVVYVWRGIPSSVEVFRDVTGALEREEQIRARIDPHTDDVAVFESSWNGGIAQEI